MSLDGFIAPLDGSVDWLSDLADGSGFTAFLATIGGIIMGRRGFDTERTWAYDSIPVTVMTTQTIDAKPSSVETAKGDPATALAPLRARVRFGDIWLFGEASSLAPSSTPD